MRSSLCRNEKSQHCPAGVFQRSIMALLILLAALAPGCGGASKGTDANAPASSSPKSDGTANTNAGSHAASSQFGTIDIKEPERFSVTLTISAQETASEAPAPMLTQQLSLAKIGADRRWAFGLPAPLGQIVYLEKSGLRYLVVFERKQYVELTPDAIDFQLGEVFTPHAIAERLKSRQYENLGLEPVNGRTAIKYRATAASDGSNRGDGVIFVDQETGLPLRSELNITAPSGTKARMIAEVRDVQLNPDRAQFDVPAGMKKISPQEARQQLGSFVSALRPFADFMGGRNSTSVANVGQPVMNKNANRSGR